MMRVETLAPDPRLSHLVQRYQSRLAHLGDGMIRLPLPARPDVLIEFYFTRPHLVEDRSTGRRERTGWAVGVGPQSFQAATLLLSGEIDCFTAHLRPTALHTMFGVAMPGLTDGAVDAAHLFGPRAARELHERLAEADGFYGRARLMDLTLLARAPSAQADVVAAAAEKLRRTDGLARVDDLAQAADLSPRHFRRRFVEQVGMTPKLYARVVRFKAALDAKTAAPRTSWTEIAHTFGWFDQAHLDKDFRAFAGASPSAFVRAPPPRG